ncbi:MAG TPA: GGDEF domain-containing protein [Spirochaetota bacterium]|nr:GGDEF domain-containing protein [Spirochaetota bacterium]
MDKKIRKRKNFVFLSVSFFFYFSMIFLFWNMSGKMYKNAAILFILRDSNNLQHTLIYILDNDEKKDGNEVLIGKNSNLIKNLCKYPPIYSFKLYSGEKKLIYNFGRDIELKSNKGIDDLKTKSVVYNRNLLKNYDKEAYQILFTLSKNNKILGYGDIIYDLSYIENNVFQDRRIIFLLVAFLSFFIIFFLMVMILNMQKRISMLENEVNETSVLDNVTELYNKDHLIELMKKEFERVDRKGGKVALLTIDIDNFLDINDKYGYEFGDLILKTVSKLIKEVFRNFDIAGRFGGDEIMVLMVDASEEEGFSAAERYRIAIQENKFYYETNEITVTVSIGVSSLENTDKLAAGNAQNILRNITFDSLNALARAKRTGRNKVVKYCELNKS